MTSEPTPSPTPTSGPALEVARPRRWPIYTLLGLLLVGGAIAGYISYKRAELRRYNFEPIVMPERMARVPANWSAQTLADRLEKSKKIRDEDSFKEAAEEIGLKEVLPGGYWLPKTAGPRELATLFKAGPTHQEITFPEGFTVARIASRLQKNGFASGGELLKLPAPTYEGRLFPDTYLLGLKAPAKTVAGMMMGRWQEVMKKLPRPFPVVDGKALTEMQVVTLASLVEREAASRAEMPLVAGVMLGRMRKPMRLQIDASVQYARTLAGLPHKPRLLFEDLEIPSAYNTYQINGLPPAPICNPGEAALKAAVRPQSTTALFYVYSPKLKRHLFAATFEQHKHNIAVARQERAAIEKAEIEAGISDNRE